MKTVTQEQIDRFKKILKVSGSRAAQEALRPELDAAGFDATERMQAWNVMKADMYQEQEDEAKAKKAQKKAAAKASPSIKKTCEAILAKSFMFNDRELSFLGDIKTRRKLTEKQNSWLVSLANKASVEISGSFDLKTTKLPIPDLSFEEYCEEYLDLHVALMGDAEKAEAHEGFLKFLNRS